MYMINNKKNSRSSDDDFGINKLLIEFRVLSFLVRCSDKGVSLILEPFSDTELILSCT
jgi:hypothetical protein